MTLSRGYVQHTMCVCVYLENALFTVGQGHPRETGLHSKAKSLVVLGKYL